MIPIKCEKIITEESEHFLNESLGAFEEQYELSKEIADIVYELSQDKAISYQYKTSYNKVFETINITNNYNVGSNTIRGQISGLDVEEKKIYIDFFIDENLIKSKIRFKTLLINCIAHELMHGNIFFNRYQNNVEINDAPIYYDVIVRLIGEYEDDILGEFARGLYITYYHEMNALISQTNIQLYAILGYGKEHNNQEIKNALKKTEIYYVYNTLLYLTLPKINRMNDETLKNKIVIPFQYNGVDIDVEWVRKQCKKMEYKAKLAFNNIFRNAMIKGKNIYENIRLLYYDTF